MAQALNTVIDSSALLAYLNNESGAEKVASYLAWPAKISVVNWAEVLSWYASRGHNPAKVAIKMRHQGILDQTILIASPTEEDAQLVSEILSKFPKAGLSLADRFCLALAARLKQPVITADRSWTTLDLGIKILSIR